MRNREYSVLKYTMLFDKDTKYIVTKYTLHYTTILLFASIFCFV